MVPPTLAAASCSKCPCSILTDTGAEFTAEAVRGWLGRVGVKTLYIERGSPRENGYVENCNDKLQDDLFNGEVLTTLLEARVLVERWTHGYNTARSHQSLGHRPPAPETFAPSEACGAQRSRPLMAQGATLGVTWSLVQNIVDRSPVSPQNGEIVEEARRPLNAG